MTITPAEIELLITLVQAAITEGKDLYDASQLKALADIGVKLAAQLQQTAQDRVVAEADIDGRDAQIEAEIALAKAKP